MTAPMTGAEYLESLDDGRVVYIYGERVAKAYPKNPAGQTLFPFRRLFMVAQRSA